MQKIANEAYKWAGATVENQAPTSSLGYSGGQKGAAAMRASAPLWTRAKRWEKKMDKRAAECGGGEIILGFCALEATHENIGHKSQVFIMLYF